MVYRIDLGDFDFGDDGAWSLTTRSPWLRVSRDRCGDWSSCVGLEKVVVVVVEEFPLGKQLDFVVDEARRYEQRKPRFLHG
jgi:hypothetical protein